MRTIGQTWRWGAVCAVTALTLTACGTGTNGAAQPTRPTAPTSTVAGTSSSAPKATPNAKAKADPKGKPTSKVTKVERNGKKPEPDISAKPAPFDREVSFTDGLRLKILKIKQGKAGGIGLPGEFPDRPTTTFDVRLTNGTKKPLELDGVIVTVTYGASQTTARLVYGKTSRDFSGTVRPGKSTTARYSVSVPQAQLSDVTMHLDLDGTHTLATFTGAAK